MGGHGRGAACFGGFLGWSFVGFGGFLGVVVVLFGLGWGCGLGGGGALFFELGCRGWLI